MNTALYCIGTKRPSAREPETALYRIGMKRTRRDARDAREPNGNPMGRLGQRRRRAERRAGRAARGASFQGVVFVCAAQEPEERSHVIRRMQVLTTAPCLPHRSRRSAHRACGRMCCDPEILSAASAAKRKVGPCLP